MEKNEVKEFVNEVIEELMEESKKKSIPLSKIETALIKVLKRKLNRDLTEEEIEDIKKVLKREKLTAEIEKKYDNNELENVFEKMTENKDTTELVKSEEMRQFFGIANTAFDIAEKGLGTYLVEKSDIGILTEENEFTEKLVQPFVDFFNNLSGSFFKSLSSNNIQDSLNEELQMGTEEKKVFKEFLSDKKNLEKIVEKHSENAKETGELTSDEEKFVSNVHNLIKRIMG
ncbi:hypothetical protein [Fusobacterium perfoetens]|uniref:hypothetical protein n=1 Tax=Fusobacterium perfoetens TaxID=852 RepID=UPI001F186A7B|nr:hypothetical protein [Fusobacterium perfoetens]MCF2611862.1 hypothetical protein [Fusobacterium perfoetens]